METRKINLTIQIPEWPHGISWGLDESAGESSSSGLETTEELPDHKKDVELTDEEIRKIQLRLFKLITKRRKEKAED